MDRSNPLLDSKTGIPPCGPFDVLRTAPLHKCKRSLPCICRISCRGARKIEDESLCTAHRTPQVQAIDAQKAHRIAEDVIKRAQPAYDEDAHPALVLDTSSMNFGEIR